jgi:hypothetical protein
MKIARIAIAPALALTLVGGIAFDASANARGDDAAAECGVVISGGEVSNQTDIFISADAGTAISDASGGSNNVATGGGGDGGDDGSVDVASAGNGGGANASANGGAVSLGDINSGGNAGNGIVVGDTSCFPAPVEEKKPAADDKKVYDAPAADAPAAADVVALPSTGVGGFDAGLLSALAAAGAAGAAGLGLRRR